MHPTRLSATYCWNATSVLSKSTFCPPTLFPISVHTPDSCHCRKQISLFLQHYPCGKVQSAFSLIVPLAAALSQSRSVSVPRTATLESQLIRAQGLTGVLAFPASIPHLLSTTLSILGSAVIPQNALVSTSSISLTVSAESMRTALIRLWSVGEWRLPYLRCRVGAGSAHCHENRRQLLEHDSKARTDDLAGILRTPYTIFDVKLAESTSTSTRDHW
ncbi:hypothetical protein F4604DRAFT_345902 [Suillus subluteus]|nr:hypothetical protein F4604DRAFT_345902 [Suillus subluteus]